MSETKAGIPVVQKYSYFSDIQEEIQTGDLICWRINRADSFFTFILYLYHKFFKATYSHIAIAVRMGDTVFAVEATYPLVRMMPLSRLGNFYLYRLGIPYKRSNTTVLLRHLGKRYSLWDMLKNMLSISSSTEDFYCSELGNDFYENIGFFKGVIDEFDRDIVTPDMLTKKVIEQSQAQAEFVRIDKGNLYAD